ncbi:MAG TPA: adenylate/guanylate cyclase domain-containing protein [Geminicoccaceae bacterium]|nr:adenylate/guanylate cyclase domain-containing protein [Geminicoccaceae bacterium]
MDRTIVRKLTTILAADVEGYSRLMAADEVATLRALRDCRAVFGRLIARRGGRIVNTAGEGLLAAFPSVVEAVNCAVEVQRELAGRSATREPDSSTRFRIGVHLGDVMVDGGDLFGEGVNLAARLQALAEPGGILISEPVYQQVRSKAPIGFSYLGERRPKNFPEDVPIYGIVLDDRTAPGAGASRFWRQAGAASGRAQGASPPERLGQPPVAVAPARPGSPRRAGQYAVILLGLAAIDLSTDGGPWIQWPALSMAMALGLEVAPLLARGWLNVNLMRFLVIVLGLLAINALTWSGYFWAPWPIGGLTALVLLRMVSRRRASAGP